MSYTVALEEKPGFLHAVIGRRNTRANVQGYVFNPMLESMYNFESISKK